MYHKTTSLECVHDKTTNFTLPKAVVYFVIFLET
jgi:hypothetical protein